MYWRAVGILRFEQARGWARWGEGALGFRCREGGFRVNFSVCVISKVIVNLQNAHGILLYNFSKRYMCYLKCTICEILSNA